MNNHLQHMITSILNGQLTKKSYITILKKKNCESILNVLWDEGFISGYSIISGNKVKIFLKYNTQRPAISNINFISQPGLKVHCSAKQLWKFETNKNLIILSTNKGIFSLENCKKKQKGGELLLSIK